MAKESAGVYRDPRWKAVRLQVLTRDNHICSYCGNEADTVDHIIPLAAGGPPFDPNNLQAMCRKCNGKKQDRTQVRMPWKSSRWFG